MGPQGPQDAQTKAAKQRERDRVNAEAVRKVQFLHERRGLRPEDIAAKTQASVRQVYRWLSGSAPRTGALRANIDEVYQSLAA